MQPDVVVVELCQYRVSMLKMDEKTLLKEAKEINLEKLQQAIKQVWFLQWELKVYVEQFVKLQSELVFPRAGNLILLM